MLSVVMLLFFTTAFIVAERNYADIQEARFEQSVYELIGNVQNEALAAYQAGPGYERDFTLPRTLVGTPYTIQLRTNQTPEGKDEVLVTIRQEEYFRFLQVPVDGTLSTGKLRIRGGDPVNITTVP